MANADASEFRLEIKGFDPSANADTEAHAVGPAKTRRSIIKRLIQGAGDDQMTVLLAEDTDDPETSEIAASGTRSFDLKTETDFEGVAGALTDVALLFVEHKGSSSASSIHIEANAADGFTNLLGTAAAFTLRPGDFVLVGAFTADNLLVEAANKVLDINNDDGANTAAYRIEIWGRI